jgi:hypothetical protein
LLVVDVDFTESNLAGLGVFGGQGLEGRRNHLARAAPVGVDYVQ